MRKTSWSVSLPRRNALTVSQMRSRRDAMDDAIGAMAVELVDMAGGNYDSSDLFEMLRNYDENLSIPKFISILLRLFDENRLKMEGTNIVKV